MELSERESEIEEGERDGALSPATIVLAVMVSCSLPPPVRVAVIVMEYSVPSSRPVSVYIVRVQMVLEPVKQSVSVAE